MKKPKLKIDLADGFPYPPFKWARLRAELDAIYAHLYGLTRVELDYILETFPIVKRKDIKKYRNYSASLKRSHDGVFEK